MNCVVPVRQIMHLCPGSFKMKTQRENICTTNPQEALILLTKPACTLKHITPLCKPTEMSHLTLHLVLALL